MRPLLAFAPALLAACATAPPAARSNARDALATPDPREDDVRAWSHGVLDAYDRGDVRAFESTLGSGFIHFEGGDPTGRDVEVARLARRKPGAPHIARRSWSHEHVYLWGDHAVFIGEAVEHMGGNDSHGGQDFDGWYTLVWARAPGGWKLSLWSWQRGGVSAERDTWNDVYRRASGFEKSPNRLLGEAVRGRTPGAALDVAMGQGRNALYLASLGWKVTGVDFSDEGIRVAREAAASAKLPLDTVNADIDTYDFGSEKWDLVTMIYATANVRWVERARASLKPGGLFVLEYFHKEGATGDGFTSGQLAALFREGFSILRDEVVEDRPDWAMDRATLVRFVAQKR